MQSAALIDFTLSNKRFILSTFPNIPEIQSPCIQLQQHLRNNEVLTMRESIFAFFLQRKRCLSRASIVQQNAGQPFRLGIKWNRNFSLRKISNFFKSKKENDICLEFRVHQCHVRKERGEEKQKDENRFQWYLFRFHSRPNYFRPRISIEKRIGRKSDRPAICRKPRRSCFLAPDNIWSIHFSTEADVGPSNLGPLPCPCTSSHTYGTRSNRGDSPWVPHGPVSQSLFDTFSLSHHFRICHLSRANEAVNEIEIYIYFCCNFFFNEVDTCNFSSPYIVKLILFLFPHYFNNHGFYNLFECYKW